MPIFSAALALPRSSSRYDCQTIWGGGAYSLFTYTTRNRPTSPTARACLGMRCRYCPTLRIVNIHRETKPIRALSNHKLCIIVQEKQHNTTAFEFDYNLKKVEWKTLSTDKMPCDGNTEKPSTTRCITRHLEREVGCSMGLQHGNVSLEK